MNTAAKIGTGASAVVVAGLVALAVPAVTSAMSAAAPAVQTVSAAPATEEPTEAAPAVEPGVVEASATAEPAAATEGTGKCPVWIYPDDVWPYDTGAIYGATGTAVGYDAEGHVVSYTVAPNDSPVAIGERFCIDYSSLGPLNDRVFVALHPGEVLKLHR